MRDIVVISYKTVHFVFHDNHKNPEKYITAKLNLDTKENCVYIPEAISQDDSIRELKQKIFKYCPDTFMQYFGFQPVIDEMYMYISTIVNLDIKSFYYYIKELDNIDKYLETFDISDLDTFEFKKRLETVIKSEFIYNNIVEVFEKYNAINICQFKPLSISFGETSSVDNVFKTTDTINQDIKTYNRDGFLIMDSKPNIIRLQKQGFKLDTSASPKIYRIYLELARDLTNNALIKIFFPLLHMQEINTVEELKQKETTLFSNNVGEMDEVYNKQEGIISYFRNLQLKEDFVKEGYNIFQYEIKPNKPVKVRLDTLFKLIQTSEQFPLSRINYGKTHDKLYRLYTKEETLQGEKIPFIDKAYINRVKKLSGRANMITIYSSTEIQGEKVALYLDVNENCHISISTETKNVLLQGEIIAGILIKTVTPVIKMLSNYLKNGGYDYEIIKYFEPSLVKNADYKGILSLKNPLSLANIKTCLHPFFYIISDKMTKGIVLLYKRTSGFIMNNDSAIDYYIYQMISAGIQNKDIVAFLVENFGISKEDAAKKFAVFKSNLDVMGDEGHKHQKKYSGIFITIKHIPSSSDIEVNIKDITNVRLLPYIKATILGMIEIALHGKQSILKTICTEKVDLTAMRAMNIGMIEEPIEERVTELEDLDEMGGGGILDEFSDDDDEKSSPKQHIFKAISSDSSESLQNIEDATPTVNKPGVNNVMDDISSDEESEEEIIKKRAPSPKKRAPSPKKRAPSPKKRAPSPKKRAPSPKKRTPSPKPEVVKEQEQEYEINRDKESLIGKPLDLFHKKLKTKEPTLFVTENGPGKFNSYSRTCPSNVKRQPILLTQEEKKRVDNESEGAYDGAIEYGTTPDNSNWYICPRYWCLLNDVPLTDQEVKDGKCGGKVIPHDAKKIPKDAFIYEFYAKSEHNNNGKYITHYPHLLDSSKHREGFCAPCCFKQKEGKAVVERDIKCKKEEAERNDKFKFKMQMDKPEEEVVNLASVKSPKKNSSLINNKKDLLIKQSILGGDKTPLPANRFGFLQPSLEIFMNIVHSSYFVKGTTNKLKQGDKHVLRIGVENNIKQSFLAALANIYSIYYDSEKTIKTIKEFKELIVGDNGIVNVGNFMTFQNGSLFTTFAEKTKSKNQETILKGAFNNFKTFIMDDNNIIDYTYLWDIVVEKNGLFRTSNNKYAGDTIHNGMNLVILEIGDHDGTSNVNIICPTAIYSNSKYSVFKKTIIIVKQGEFYEPICFYSEKGKNVTLNVAFSKNDNDPGTKKTGMLKMLEGFKQLSSACLSPSTSVQEIKRNVGIQQLVKLIFSHNENYNKKTLKEIGENFKLVLNYNNKVIGIQTDVTIGEQLNKAVYIPCYATTHRIMEQFDSISIDEAFQKPPELIVTIEILSILHNHLNTTKITEKMNTKMRKDFGIITQDSDEREGYNSLPIRIVTSQSMDSMDTIAIGILTNANQFIRTKPVNILKLPRNLPLEYLDGTDYYEFDRAITTGTKDSVSYNMVKNIRLETIFYNLYRQTFKTLLNEPASYILKNVLLQSLEKGNINEHNRTIIQDLIRQGVEFIDDMNLDDITISNLDEITSCFSTNASNCSTNGICVVENGICKLLLPRINLVNKQTDNKTSYYEKLIDELLRFKRIRNYIFQPDAYLAIRETTFKLHPDEYLIYESELNQDKLNELKNKEKKHKLYRNIHELSQPDKVVQKYNKLFAHGHYF
tara:strand:- start:8586 stop:13715 length:5130 start_codon:yes stop_codon:yes gene_type:complete